MSAADEVKKRKALSPAEDHMDFSEDDDDDDDDDGSDGMELDDGSDDGGALEELNALPRALYAYARSSMAKLSRPNEHGFHEGVSSASYRSSLLSIRDALEKSRSVVFEAVDPSLKDMYDKYMKRTNKDDGKVPPGSASVERCMADNKCLLCLLCLELAAVRDMLGDGLVQGDDSGVLMVLHEALMWFPRSVQANVLLAKFLRPLADSEEKMKRVEEALRKAIACGNLIDKTKIALGAGEDEEEQEGYDEEAMNNELLLQEMRWLSAARQMLALLYCQGGRDADAKKHLLAEGFRWRLTSRVLNYSNNTQGDENALVGGRRAAAALDRALPQHYLQHLQLVFAASSPFWREHSYDVLANSSRTAGYFSYLYPLRERQAKCSIEHIIDYLYRTVVTSLFPEAAAGCSVAEWWVHTRPHSSGHQLHFDSDETRTQSTGVAAHPLVSLVVYVNECSELVGGPTLITDQTLPSQRLANKGWLCFPKCNRVLAFDARYLHGVIPGKGLNPSPSDRRLSFMVGFWSSIQSTQRSNGLAGPGQHLPHEDSGLQWPTLMTGLDTSVPAADSSTATPASLVPVEEVWEAVDRSCVATAIMLSKVKLPHVDQMFQF